VGFDETGCMLSQLVLLEAMVITDT